MTGRSRKRVDCGRRPKEPAGRLDAPALLAPAQRPWAGHRRRVQPPLLGAGRAHRRRCRGGRCPADFAFECRAVRGVGLPIGKLPGRGDERDGRPACGRAAGCRGDRGGRWAFDQAGTGFGRRGDIGGAVVGWWAPVVLAQSGAGGSVDRDRRDGGFARARGRTSAHRRGGGHRPLRVGEATGLAAPAPGRLRCGGRDGRRVQRPLGRRAICGRGPARHACRSLSCCRRWR